MLIAVRTKKCVTQILFFRPLWRHYYKNNQTIIFVVDSEDREQLETAKAELWNILDHEDTKGANILVFANKQVEPKKKIKVLCNCYFGAFFTCKDRPCALSCIELTDKLGLPKITDRSWNMQSCSAVTGKGLYEGMDWIVEQLEKK